MTIIIASKKPSLKKNKYKQKNSEFNSKAKDARNFTVLRPGNKDIINFVDKKIYVVIHLDNF